MCHAHKIKGDKIMEDNLIMFGSVTLAMKSRDVLSRRGMQSRLMRTPVQLKTNSCGYSLFVPYEFDKALQIIGSSGITVLGTAAVMIK